MMTKRSNWREVMKHVRMAVLAVGALCVQGSVLATELVYAPVNPSFGGSSLNGSYLLSNAQAQNTTTDPDQRISAAAKQSDLQRFNDLLQRSILSRLAASLTTNIIDPLGGIQPGTIETAAFTINIVDAGGGLLEITTTDKATGEFTSFQVSSQF